MLAKTLFLTFHGIGEPLVRPAEGERRYFVPVEVYRRTIAMLAAFENAYDARIRITFDDGNMSDYLVGLPALVDAGRQAHFFVLAGRIGKPGYLSGRQIRELRAAGMVIGTHGWHHVDWRMLDEDGRRREFYDARRRIEDEAGCPVDGAAVPFGAFDRRVLADLAEAGYSRIYTSTGGLALEGTWFCPRWSVTEAFDPDRDIPPRLAMKDRLRGTAYAPLRRLRYRF